MAVQKTRKMQKTEKTVKVVVIDGQGGALGRSVIEALGGRALGCEILAVGTNGTATVARLGAGASAGATGENPVRVACADADIVVGPVGIVVANAMLGEVTPEMARAVGACRAKKFLIPVNRCDVVIPGTENLSYADSIRLAAEAVLSEAKKIQGA